MSMSGCLGVPLWNNQLASDDVAPSNVLTCIAVVYNVWHHNNFVRRNNQCCRFKLPLSPKLMQCWKRKAVVSNALNEATKKCRICGFISKEKNLSIERQPNSCRFRKSSLATVGMPTHVKVLYGKITWNFFLSMVLTVATFIDILQQNEHHAIARRKCVEEKIVRSRTRALCVMQWYFSKLTYSNLLHSKSDINDLL